MKTLIGLALLCAGVPIAVDGQALQQSVLISVGKDSSGVTIVSHSLKNTCTNVTTCTFTGQTYGSGDDVIVYVGYCNGSGCSSGTGAITVSDGGTNTYTEQTCAHQTAVSTYYIFAYLAKNVTAGTYTVSIQNVGATMFFMNVEVVDLHGANATTPVDPNVCTSGHVTGSTSPSLVSNGNVSETGSVVLATGAFASGFSLTGSFSTLDSGWAYNYTHPASGGTVTLSGTQSSGAAEMSMIGIQP